MNLLVVEKINQILNWLMSQFQNLPVLGLRSFVNKGSLSGVFGGSTAASVGGEEKVMNL